MPQQVSEEGLSPGAQPARRVVVWDLSVRIVHWVFPLALVALWWTDEEGQRDRHAVIGYCVLALLIYRLLWGLFGSETSRFSALRLSPSAALEHLRHLLSPGKLARTVGHNPLGSYATLLLIISLAVQAVTGLFLYDDEFFWAPLNGWVGEETAGTLNEIHRLNFNVLLGLIALHIAAVVLYRVAKGLDLITPMVTGTADLPAGLRSPRIAPLWLAMLLGTLAAGGVWALVTFA